MKIHKLEIIFTNNSALVNINSMQAITKHFKINDDGKSASIGIELIQQDANN